MRDWTCPNCGAGYPTIIDEKIVCGSCRLRATMVDCGYQAGREAGFVEARETIRDMCEDFAGLAAECGKPAEQAAWLALRKTLEKLHPDPLPGEADDGKKGGSDG